MTSKKMFIGFDCHKETHHCVGIDIEGKEILNFELKNTFDEMHNTSLLFVQLSEEYKIIIGVEGSRYYGIHLADSLKIHGFEVLEVCSNITRSRRRTTWGTGKSDPVDALIVARTVRDEYEKLSELNYDQATEVIINISRRREDLVQMRAIELRRLHSFLTVLNPEYKKKGDILQKKVRNYWLNYCKRQIPKTKDKLLASKLHCIKSLIYTITFLQQSVDTIDMQLEAAKTKDVEILMSIKGIGLISACKILSYIGNIYRFSSSSKLAAYAGLSPVTFASGKYLCHKSSLKGNRKLNSVYYSIALTASQNDPISKAYYLRKQQEGKTKKQALLCLARRMLKLTFGLLTKQEFYDSKVHTNKISESLTQDKKLINI